MREARVRLEDSPGVSVNFTAPELANFIAAKAVAAVTSYLDGRSAHASLAYAANRVTFELQMVGNEPGCNAIADPIRMLVVAMTKASIVSGARWETIMAAFVPLLRKRSLQMRAGGFPGDNARHDAASDDEGILPGGLRP